MDLFSLLNLYLEIYDFKNFPNLLCLMEIYFFSILLINKMFQFTDSL